MEEEKKIYIGNVEYSVTEEELQRILEDKGLEVKELKLIRDKFSGRSKGFGFAEFESDDQAQKAIEALDGQELKSRKLRVSRALRREDKFSSRGGGRQFRK
jgi:RNA recognition motif-containing protein